MFFRGIQFSLFALLSLFLSNAFGFYSVTLGWDPPTTYTDGSPLPPAAIGGYILHYGTTSQHYTLQADVGKVTMATLGGLADGTTTYVVATAYDLAHSESPFSVPELVVPPPAPPPPTGDTIPPSVTLTAPAPGATVPPRTTVTLAANATDNVGVTTVAFFVNGTLTCSDTTSPYTCAWTVPGRRNRTYTLQAKAYDAQGNIGTSSTITVVSR